MHTLKSKVFSYENLSEALKVNEGLTESFKTRLKRHSAGVHENISRELFADDVLDCCISMTSSPSEETALKNVHVWFICPSAPSAESVRASPQRPPASYLEVARRYRCHLKLPARCQTPMARFSLRSVSHGNRWRGGENADSFIHHRDGDARLFKTDWRH